MVKRNGKRIMQMPGFNKTIFIQGHNSTGRARAHGCASNPGADYSDGYLGPDLPNFNAISNANV